MTILKSVLLLLSLTRFSFAYAQTDGVETPDVANLTRIRLCVPDARTEFITLVMRAATKRGYFHNHGLNVKLVKTSADGNGTGRKRPDRQLQRPDAMDYFVASRVAGPEPLCELGNSSIERFLSNSSGMSRLTPLMVSYYGESYDTHLIVAKNSPIKSVKELKGKWVHVGQLPTYLAVTGLLASNGMSLQDVKIEHSLEGGPERLEALQNGTLAAMTAYLPSMAYLLATDKVRILSPNVVSKFVSPRVPHSLLIVNKEFAAKNPKVVTEFMAAMQEGYDYIVRNPSEILNIFRTTKFPRGGESWYAMTDVDVEKAAAFLGKVKAVQLKPGTEDTAQVYCASRQFGDLIIKNGMMASQVDLGDWLQVAAAQRTCK